MTKQRTMIRKPTLFIGLRSFCSKEKKKKDFSYSIFVFIFWFTFISIFFLHLIIYVLLFLYGFFFLWLTFALGECDAIVYTYETIFRCTRWSLIWPSTLTLYPSYDIIIIKIMEDSLYYKCPIVYAHRIKIKWEEKLKKYSFFHYTQLLYLFVITNENIRRVKWIWVACF